MGGSGDPSGDRRPTFGTLRSICNALFAGPPSIWNLTSASISFVTVICRRWIQCLVSLIGFTHGRNTSSSFKVGALHDDDMGNDLKGLLASSLPHVLGDDLLPFFFAFWDGHKSREPSHMVYSHLLGIYVRGWSCGSDER